MIDSREEARQVLKFASAYTPLDEYDAWHARHSRPLDLGGFDAPRTDWRAGPRFRLVASLGRADRLGLERTVQSLRAQLLPEWTLHLLCGGDARDDALAAYRQWKVADPRLLEVGPDAELPAVPSGGTEWVGAIELGDQLPAHGLAVFAEALATQPDAVVAYGDEDSVDAEGKLHSPRFKPDWSPHFFASSSYLGRLTLLRADALAHAGCRSGTQLMRQERELIAAVVSSRPRGAVCHVRRLTYRRAARARDSFAAPASAGKSSEVPAAASRHWPSVSIIVPTRDRAALLAACLRGLRETTDYPSFDVVVVDNGTAEPAAVTLLQELESVPRFRVLRRPGPFNYAALCNDGVAASQGEVLVFLNNDVEIHERDWLRPIVVWAMRPDVGAVGAKLSFPGGGIEHAGVVLGLSGLAMHPYRGLPRDHPGYLDRLRVPHEVSAVTAACLAIERSKFEAIGGLDAAHLPVELNDTDLCLRLAERGWVTMWTPDSRLDHAQSASRGRQFRPFDVYSEERRYFARRWAHVIRDDPYFHPALSLFAHRVSLA
jgi:GT2 family glycosyltransferase